MFRRIGKFIEDIAETIKRERGNLKIIDHKTGDSILIEVRESDVFNESSVKLLAPENPADKLILNTLEDDSPDPFVMGEEDHSPPPDFFSENIRFDVVLPNDQEREINSEYSIKIETVDVKKDPTVSGIADLKTIFSDAFSFQNEPLREVNFEIRAYDEMSFQFNPTEFSEMYLKTPKMESVSTEFDPVELKTLDSEFIENQASSFHYEDTVDFGTRVSSCEIDFTLKINDTIAAAMHFPIKRPPVSKSGYQLEEIKRALTFIIEKFESKGKLKIIGIYKNVPIYAAQKLTFTKDKCLLFYYRKQTERADNGKKRKINKHLPASKPFMLDVLVVKSREGKYHVGPIIRTA